MKHWSWKFHSKELKCTSYNIIGHIYSTVQYYVQGHRKDFWSGPAVIGTREARMQLLNINFIKSPKKWSSQNRSSRTSSYTYDVSELVNFLDGRAWITVIMVILQEPQVHTLTQTSLHKLAVGACHYLHFNNKESACITKSTVQCYITRREL